VSEPKSEPRNNYQLEEERTSFSRNSSFLQVELKKEEEE